MANISLNNPTIVNVEEQSTISTSTKLDQGYIIIESKERFRLLYTFLRKNKNSLLWTKNVPKNIFEKNVLYNM